MQFVNRIRLSVARDRLRAGHESVSDIAYQVGYSDPNYFTRAYSAEFGETPSETRK
jgi:AraC-like DNA-binding protein